MRAGIPVIAIVLLGSGCGGEPGVPRAELDALLQRLDALDRRLDALEEAAARPPVADDRPAAPSLDVLAIPAPATATAEADAVSTLSVRVGTGDVELDGKAVAEADLPARLREVARTKPGTRLALVAEPDVPYDAMIRVIDVAREAGLTDVAISVRVHGEGAPAGEP